MKASFPAVEFAFNLFPRDGLHAAGFDLAPATLSDDRPGFIDVRIWRRLEALDQQTRERGPLILEQFEGRDSSMFLLA